MDASTPLMEILVGPIASGKSTYARRRAADGAIVVCDDDLVLACHAGLYDMYDPRLKPMYMAMEAAVITHAASLGRDIVVDTGGRTRSRRSRFAALGRSLGYTPRAVLFEWKDAETHARRRFEHDPRGYSYERWLTVALRHEQEFQPVAPEEGLT